MVKTDETLGQLLALRVVVAFLGEKEQFAWWGTRFLGPTGRKFLEFTFPRSTFAAAVTSSAAAARVFHDSRIGKGRVFHLFRLAQVIEHRMHSLLLSGSGVEVAKLVSSKDEALAELKRLAQSSSSAADGPVHIGSSGDIASGRPIPNLSALYLDAFTTGKRTLPYFAEQ